MKSIGTPVSLAPAGSVSPLSLVVVKGVPSSFSIFILTYNSVSESFTYCELLPIIENLLKNSLHYSYMMV